MDKLKELAELQKQLEEYTNYYNDLTDNNHVSDLPGFFSSKHKILNKIKELKAKINAIQNDLELPKESKSQRKLHDVEGAKQGLCTTMLLTFAGYVPNVPKDGDCIIMTNPNDSKDLVMFDAVISGNKQLEMLANRFIQKSQMSDNLVNQLMAKNVADTLNGQQRDVDMNQLLYSAIKTSNNLMLDISKDAAFTKDIIAVYDHVYKNVLNNEFASKLTKHPSYQDPEVQQNVTTLFNQIMSKASIVVPSKKL